MDEVIAGLESSFQVQTAKRRGLAEGLLTSSAGETCIFGLQTSFSKPAEAQNPLVAALADAHLRVSFKGRHRKHAAEGPCEHRGRHQGQGAELAAARQATAPAVALRADVDQLPASLGLLALKSSAKALLKKELSKQHMALATT